MSVLTVYSFRMLRNRKIGPFLATMLVATNMVGSGIFLLPATLATVGSITIVGWAIGFAGALLIALVLSRLAQIAPRAGGPCTYAAESMGRYVGFQANAVYWVSAWSGTVAVAVGAVGYLTTFCPALQTPVSGAVATVAVIWLMTLANILGPRFVCQLETAAVVVGVIPILIVAIGGWWFFDAQTFRASWNVQHEPAVKVIPASLVLLFWAFTGLEVASISTAVVENPRRNVPIATVGGVLIAAVLYTASSSVIMGLIPADKLSQSVAPFADAVRLMFGPSVAAIVALGALLKTLGTLGGQVLCTAQTGKAGADRGLLPPLFARVDRAGIPVLNYMIIASLMSGVVFVTISPTVGEQFGKLIDVSTTLCLITYLYACISMWHYTEGAADPRGAFRSRCIAGLALLFCVGVIALSDKQLLFYSAVVVALTVPLYPLVRRIRQPMQ